MENGIPASMISIHDNIIYAYSVDCENRRIVLHTRFPNGPATEYIDVIFTGVIAHHFEHALAHNILFDVTETGASEIVTVAPALFAAGQPYGWPDGIEYCDAEELIRILERRGACGFQISGSYGMRGG